GRGYPRRHAYAPAPRRLPSLLTGGAAYDARSSRRAKSTIRSARPGATRGRASDAPLASALELRTILHPTGPSGRQPRAPLPPGVSMIPAVAGAVSPERAGGTISLMGNEFRDWALRHQAPLFAAGAVTLLFAVLLTRRYSQDLNYTFVIATALLHGE